MSDSTLHKLDTFSKDLGEIHFHLSRLLRLLDEMEISLYHSRQTYGALQKACGRLDKSWN